MKRLDIVWFQLHSEKGRFGQTVKRLVVAGGCGERDEQADHRFSGLWNYSVYDNVFIYLSKPIENDR